MSARQTLTRCRLRLRDAAMGFVAVDGHECGGLGIVPRAVADHVATAMAFGRWQNAPAAARGPRPEPIIINGFQIIHASSGLALTPLGWVLPTFDAAEICVRLLLERVEPGTWERPAEPLRPWRAIALCAHEDAGAFIGKASYPRRLNSMIDEAAYADRLAQLRAGRSCDDWMQRGPVNTWGAPR